MKKIICATLALIMIAALASCGKQSEKTAEENTGISVDESAAQEYFDKREVDEYGKYTTADAERPFEEGDGVKLMSVSNQLHRGETGTLAVKGAANAQYIVKIYDDNGKVVKLTEDNRIIADENGFASYTFTFNEDNEIGSFLFLVKADGASNYVETTVTLTV